MPAAVPVPPAAGDSVRAWTADRLLGAGFEESRLGPATLVRAAGRPPAPAAAVLHVHGYNDYFFQAHLAAACAEAGLAFYAVDLRRAGRSLLPPVGGTPEAAPEDGPAHDPPPAHNPLPAHYAASLREPGADLSAAARAVRALEPGLPLVVHAHSTGGLTAALWAHAVRDDPACAPDLLVLDSPFLDLTGSWLQRAARTPVLEVLGRRRPMAVVSAAPSMYATYQHASSGGRWDFDTDLKRPSGQPVRAGWLRAVRRAQLRLARGLGVPCPVLVARAAASGADSPANPHLDSQDTVLDVARIAALAPRLGADVTQLVVDGGVHDLTLSADGPRGVYVDGMLGWVLGRLPVAAPGPPPGTPPGIAPGIAERDAS
ncbi:serine aminopeptidase domain-containing protein [Isoptericola hypogeus]|uniref:serine aminopeptidase domain-containing protein n=1 Tax=Isoptericola hypogeus TaxID=300179 RepID=UPI0031D9CC5C